MTGETTLPLDANGKMQFRIERPSRDLMLELNQAAQMCIMRSGPATMDSFEWVEIEIEPLPVATGGLVTPRALARRADPGTSRAAARSIDASLQAIEIKVLDAIADAADGATWDEVSESTGLERATVSPRFKPLREMGLIRANGTRKGKSGRSQTVWVRVRTD